MNASARDSGYGERHAARSVEFDRVDVEVPAHMPRQGRRRGHELRVPGGEKTLQAGARVRLHEQLGALELESDDESD